MNIYTDFLSLDEIQFITGRKQPARMIETLNDMGIPFVTNAHGTPIVRRDYAAPKTKTNKIIESDSEWRSNAYSGGF